MFSIWRHVRPSTHAPLNSVADQNGGILTYFDGALKFEDLKFSAKLLHKISLIISAKEKLVLGALWATYKTRFKFLHWLLYTVGSDSSVALHWILGEEDYKQFEANQLRKTREWVEVIWWHIPTDDNPAHRASRDKLVSKENQLWWREPDWLSNPRKWPKSLVTPPRNPTKKRKPHRSCSLWPWIHMTISTNSFPRTHTKKACRTKGPLSTE